jgi:DNA-binding NarL/FixJ family response regulator
MKVFLVEDSQAVCERLVEMIEQAGAHQVVGQADTYDDALTGIGATRPDVGIFDIKLRQGSGIDALAEAKRRMPDLIGIVLSNHMSPQHERASSEAGARYFLDKTSDFERITEILQQLADESRAREIR